MLVDNSGVTGGGGQGGRVPPETSDREISADLSGKKRQGRNVKGMKVEKKRRKIVNGRWKIENGRMEKFQNEERTFFSFFVCLFVCLLVCLFFAFHFSKTTKICFGCTKVEIFYPEKGFHPGKKIRKNDFAPSEKIPVTPLVDKDAALISRSSKKKVARKVKITRNHKMAETPIFKSSKMINFSELIIIK